MNSFIIDKPGRYRTRDGQEVLVFYDDGTDDYYPISGAKTRSFVRDDEYAHRLWGRDGLYYKEYEDDLDIVEYLGPLQPGDDGFGDEK